MNNNSISGQIPPELHVLPPLVHFLLDNNNLSGYLPPELAKMPTLMILQLDNNNFDGTEIPASYGNISTLLKLSLRNCKLTGSVSDISGMRRLNYLDLSQNQLSGNIPPSNLFKKVTTLDFRNNLLSDISGSLDPPQNVTVVDHASGNEKIKQLVPGIKVYGGSLDNVKGYTNELKNGNKFSFGVNISALALHTPCHTKGHVSYFVTGQDGENPAVFTGDTLFVGGCGKFFEGTADQMYQSLCVTLSSLPKPTQVYCGHEYTVKNLQFALTVEPENSKIVQKLSWAQQKREAGLPTIPSTIDEELETNPFMRVDLPELQEKIGCKSPVETIGKIRELKDNWRG